MNLNSLLIVSKFHEKSDSVSINADRISKRTDSIMAKRGRQQTPDPNIVYK